MLRHRWSAPAFRLGMGPALASGSAACMTALAGCARVFAPVLAALFLTGCAWFSSDAGMDVVSGIAAADMKKDAYKIDGEEAAAAAHARVRRLLASTLSVDAAVQVALLNNKG